MVRGMELQLGARSYGRRWPTLSSDVGSGACGAVEATATHPASRRLGRCSARRAARRLGEGVAAEQDRVLQRHAAASARLAAFGRGAVSGSVGVGVAESNGEHACAAVQGGVEEPAKGAADVGSGSTARTRGGADTKAKTRERRRLRRTSTEKTSSVVVARLARVAVPTILLNMRVILCSKKVISSKRALQQIATVCEYNRQLVKLRQEKDELCEQAQRWFKSDEKSLADSLDYEKVETKKLREEKEDLLKKFQEANSAAQKLQKEINNKEVVTRMLQTEIDERISAAREASRAVKAKDREIEMLGSELIEKETEIGRLQAKDQERSLLFNETSRIAKENAEEIQTWKQLYDEAVASHKEEIEKLDSQLVGQVVKNKRLLEASTCNIALLNNVLGEFRAEGKTPQEDTIAAHISTIGEQVGTLQELATTLKANQADSIREAVEGAVSYALAKLKAHDPNLNVQPIEVDFNCPEAEANQLIEEMQSIGKKVSEEMQLGSPSSE